MIEKIKSFIKKEVVLTVAMIAAVFSCFFVTPDVEYVGYIDWRTLAILWMLMVVMAGFQNLGVFSQVGENLVAKVSTVKGLALVFILLNFFSAMLITNDVALITFVPFTMITLKIGKKEEFLIPIIVLETIAANMGSMLTPLGNPQNLYLYGLSGMEFSEFLQVMLPYSCVALVLLLLIAVLRIPATQVQLAEKGTYRRSGKEKAMLLYYTALFFCALLVVLRVLDVKIGILLVLLCTLCLDWKRLKDADYGLLFTFLFLFIFIGNMKRIPALSDLLAQGITGREVGVSILLSQVISNVPAAILCSGFTTKWESLLIGCNLGGLGTLIASMASLISYKQYVNTKHADSKNYLLVFTGLNMLFLVVLVAWHLLLQL